MKVESFLPVRVKRPSNQVSKLPYLYRSFQSVKSHHYNISVTKQYVTPKVMMDMIRGGKGWTSCYAPSEVNSPVYVFPCTARGIK